MNAIHYDLLINVDRYKHDDGYIARVATLVLTYSGEIAGFESDPDAALDAIYERHNRDDRPDGKVGPSLSTGDLVHLVGVGYYAVGRIGFDLVDAPDDIENERSYHDVWNEERSRLSAKGYGGTGSTTFGDAPTLPAHAINGGAR